MKVKIKYHLFKFEIDKIVEHDDKNEILFKFMNSLIHIWVDKSKCENQKFIYVLSEPTFYKKKPKLLLWDFNEDNLKKVYLNLILEDINKNEKSYLKKKKIRI